MGFSENVGGGFRAKLSRRKGGRSITSEGSFQSLTLFRRTFMKLHILGISCFLACAGLYGATDVAQKPTVPVNDATTADASKSAVPAVFSPDVVAVSESIFVPTPIFSEEKNLQDRVFDASAKLRLTIPNPEKFAYAMTAPTVDGFVVAPCGISEATPAETDTLTIFRTFVTPTAFFNGKIRVKTPQKCELWVNGKKVADKLSVETELGKSGVAAADSRFEIDRYEIVVKVLTEKGSKLAPSVKIEIEPKEKKVDALAFEDGTKKRPVTIADVNEVERIGDLRLSPDGKYVLVTYSQLQETGAFARRMEVRDAVSGDVVLVDDASRNYAWMPNGSRLYFRRADPNDRCAYVEYDFVTRKETVLADNLPNSNHSYTWLPDESGFIVSKTEKWTKESSDWTRVLNMADRGGSWRDRSFLLRYDLKKGIFEPLTAGAKTTGLLGISPDSKMLLFATTVVDYTQAEYSRSNVYMLDLDTLKSELIFENEKYGVGVADWSADSKKVVMLAAPDAFNKIGSALPEGVRANSFDMQAFIYDVESKKLDPITKDFDPTVSSAVWAGDGNVYLRTVDRDMENIYRYNPNSREYTKMNIPADTVSRFSIQRNPKNFAPVAFAVGGGAVAFPKAYKVDLTKNTSERVFKSGADLEDEVAMPSVQPWRFIASDGTEIDGHYFLPADFDASKKYPMIVYYYSGTTPTARSIGAHYPFPLWASQGYVVYVLQPSGTIGYGQEFSARHLNAWGKRTSDDIIEGVKKFCADHPFVNEKKIGCIGASYGGFMTMYLQTRTDIFAAAVAHAGISDITSYWGEGMWGYAYNAIAAAGSYPWKNKEIFIERSPLFSADKVNTPILLCHGVADINVPVGESIQMFTALKLLGKPVELLTFTAEDHGIMNYNRRKQWMKSHLAWFDRWLKDDSAWWNTLYPEKNW